MNEKEYYWRIELKNQAKQIEQKVTEAILSLGGEVCNRHEDKYFSGRQEWHNPLILKVKLPPEKRFTFIRQTKIWLHRPIQIMPPLVGAESIQLRGNHDTRKHCRNYRLSPSLKAYIKDYKTGKILEGIDMVQAVLDGNLDLIYE